MATNQFINGALTANTLTITGDTKLASSGGVVYSGGTPLTSIFSTPSSGVWIVGSGSNSIKANNDSGLVASGDYSVAEGILTIASGNYSHAEGNNTIASGTSSHAGGISSIASGQTSFIHSTNSLVTGARSVIIGGQNITGTTADTVYVPKLNIQIVNSASTATTVTTIGVDSNGNIVNDNVVSLKTIKLSLNSSQLNSLSTSPINTGIPTPSAGNAICVVAAYVKYTFVSVTSSFTVLDLGDGTGNAQFVWNGVDTQNVFSPMIPSDISGSPIADNQPLLVRANSDTVGGDASADIYITYQIITL